MSLRRLRSFLSNGVFFLLASTSSQNPGSRSFLFFVWGPKVSQYFIHKDLSRLGSKTSAGSVYSYACESELSVPFATIILFCFRVQRCEHHSGDRHVVAGINPRSPNVDVGVYSLAATRESRRYPCPSPVC